MATGIFELLKRDSIVRCEVVSVSRTGFLLQEIGGNCRTLTAQKNQSSFQIRPGHIVDVIPGNPTVIINRVSVGMKKTATTI